MTTIITFLVTALIVFVLCFILVPLFMGLLRMFGLYTIVNEGTCQV